MGHRRTYLIGAAIVVLLAIVAVGARAGGGAAGHGGELRPPHVVVSISVVVFIAAVVVSVVYVGYQLIAGLAERPPTARGNKKRWWSYLIVALIIFGVRYGVLLLQTAHGRRHGTSSAGLAGPGNLTHKLPASAHLAKIPPAVTGTDLAVGAALGLAVLALAYVAFRTKGNGRMEALRPGVLPSEDVGAHGAGMVEASMDALLAEPDPRRAVIAAYRSMDASMARAGLGREPWEAPFEHLARVLEDLGAGAPVAGQLAGLFEQAKFDRRPCGPQMKEAALRALSLLRDDFMGAHTSASPSAGGAGETVGWGVGSAAG